MTPQELLRIAKNINPEKLEADPQAALEDAYVVAEAFRLAELEKVSASNYLPPAQAANVQGTLYLPKKRKVKKELSTIEHLRLYLKKHNANKRTLCKDLKISEATLYQWLSGKRNPRLDSIAKIEAFLHDRK